MHRFEALRSIYNDQLVYIQQKVPVDFDNARQQPVSFVYHGKSHLVSDVVGRFRMLADRPAFGYLVMDAEQNMFYLYAQLENGNGNGFPLLARGFGSCHSGFKMMTN